jgi:trehalose 6-phosphate phosphatase
MDLAAPLVARLLELAQATSLLVASDFDGVLAPLVLDPSASRPVDGSVDSLRALAAAPATYAAVVSGRDLGTLTALTGLEDSRVTRIGSHGGESSADSAPPTLTQAQRSTLDDVTAALDEVTRVHPGARLEHKPAAVVLHTRGMAAAAARAAEAEALEAATRHTESQVLHGKHVVEVSVVRADKGTALLALRDAVGADAVAYFGDDVTDEHVFALLGPGDVGVKVGQGDTAASWRVDGPPEVAEALALLARLRGDAHA